jgi:hypothetical protein
MAELAIFLLAVAGLTAVAIRFGMLIGKRLDEVTNRDDEEPGDAAR